MSKNFTFRLNTLMIKYPKTAGIYKLTCVVNDKIYIGKAVNISRRINRHKNCIKHEKSKGPLQRAMEKYGWESFTVEVLEIFENFDKSKDNEMLLKREGEYIEKYDSSNLDKGYNICKYSTDATGRICSEETKIKIGNSNRGKKRSDESRENIRRGKLKYGMSEEHKEKIRAFNRSRTISDETKEKMRLGRAKHLSDEHKNKIRLSLVGRKRSKEAIDKMVNTRKSKNEE